jgi:hypothetical protein
MCTLFSGGLHFVTVVHTQCVDNVYLSNIKYVFYRNTSILLIDATYVMQNVVSHTYVIQDVTFCVYNTVI